MPEQISDLGYCAVKKETTKGTAVTPTVYLPIYSESLTEDLAIQDIDPIMGLKFMRFSTIKGQRNFKGSVEFLGEPNVAGYVFDMLLTKGNTSGAGPYTHPFTLSPTTAPKSYTVDIARGRSVFRYMGIESSEIHGQFEDNRMKLVSNLSGLHCLGPREITNVSTLALTLKGDYDIAPTTGYVASDLVRIFKADGTVVDTTITSIDSSTVISVAAATGVATGDMITLRPATPSVTLVDYFQWAKSQFRISDTAANALSASHTPVEKGSDWKISHLMLPPEGAQRSGAHDPVSIVRGRGDLELKTKIFFDTPDIKNRFYNQASRAMVVRHFAGSTNQYEIRVTANQIIINGDPTHLKVGDVLFDDINWKPEYKASDSQAWDVTVINNVATI